MKLDFGCVGLFVLECHLLIWQFGIRGTMQLTTESKLSWLKRFEIDDVIQWMRFFSIMFKCPKNIFNFHGNLGQFGFYILESFSLLKISTCVGCLKVDFVKWLFRRAWTWQAILIANRNQRGRKVNVRFWMKNKWFWIQTRISKSQHQPNSDATQNKCGKTLLFFKQKRVWLWNEEFGVKKQHLF